MIIIFNTVKIQFNRSNLGQKINDLIRKNTRLFLWLLKLSIYESIDMALRKINPFFFIDFRK
jgi:hypothetical protein